MNERSRLARWRVAGVVTAPEPAGSIRPCVRRTSAFGRRRTRRSAAASLVRNGGRASLLQRPLGRSGPWLPKTHCRSLGRFASGSVVLFSSAWLALAYLKLGQPDKARRVLDRVFTEAPARTCQDRSGARHPIRQIAHAEIRSGRRSPQRGPEYCSPSADGSRSAAASGSKKSRRIASSGKSSKRWAIGLRPTPLSAAASNSSTECNVRPSSPKRYWPTAASDAATIRKRTGR